MPSSKNFSKTHHRGQKQINNHWRPESEER